MDIYTAYRILDSQLIKVLDSVNMLETVKEPDKVKLLRIQENPFVLSEESERINRSVLTAHDINQYKNQVHVISLQENVHSWLEKLLEIDKGEADYAV
jgi:hypothetical protein